MTQIGGREREKGKERREEDRKKRGKKEGKVTIRGKVFLSLNPVSNFTGSTDISVTVIYLSLFDSCRSNLYLFNDYGD